MSALPSNAASLMPSTQPTAPHTSQNDPPSSPHPGNKPEQAPTCIDDKPVQSSSNQNTTPYSDPSQTSKPPSDINFAYMGAWMKANGP
ncbi:hypothetical protein BJ508DRAFT_334192 [Ascobolus immersus RN42]|uniref:Uncharacterized protein n=1 Tax=Ascobolus immersus RN42 TaxID=1160509 RepID=A0A3N4HN66_ASCIM|nr:hypothetical protein BJ508DRAFT_334192 [Ascobolus immersus RN42]